MLLASLADWVGVVPGYSSPVVRLEASMGSNRANAWHAWILQVPAWFVVPLAAAIAAMVTLRNGGYAIPKAMPASLAIAGMAFCSVPVVECIGWGSIWAHFGPIVGVSVFTWLAVSEVRRLIARRSHAPGGAQPS